MRQFVSFFIFILPPLVIHVDAHLYSYHGVRLRHGLAQDGARLFQQ